MLPKRAVDDVSDHGSISDEKDDDDSSMGQSSDKESVHKNENLNTSYSGVNINLNNMPLQSLMVSKVVKNKGSFSPTKSYVPPNKKHRLS